MPRTCTVCGHPDRRSIDQRLVAGGSLRDIAGQFGLSKSSVERHQAEHLPHLLTQAQEAEEVARADDLLGQVRDLQARTMAILATAEVDPDAQRTALRAIAEARRNLELLARLLGELHEGATVNVLLSPDWVAVRGTLFAAVRPYPEAAVALSRAMHELAG